MAISRTSSAAFATIVGGIAGAAIVMHDDWFTWFIGLFVGCTAGFSVFIVLVILARIISPHPKKAESWRFLNWNDFNEFNDRAYKVVRFFIDDGKPW